MTVPAPEAPPKGPDPIPDPAPNPAPDPAPAPEVTATPENIAALPEWAQKHITATRTEAANYRTQLRAVEAKQTENATLLEKVAQALGLSEGKDGKPDPDKLSQDLTKAQEEARRSKIALAVYDVAGEVGINPKAVTNTISFMDAAMALDPNDSGFAGNIKTSLEKALNDYPALAAAKPGPLRSGGDMSGGKTPPEVTYATPTDRLSAAYAANGKK